MTDINILMDEASLARVARFAAVGGPMLTDFYALTMANAWFLEGQHEQLTTFYFHSRSLPFGGGYMISAGLGDFLDFLRAWHWTPGRVEKLRQLNATFPNPPLQEAFLTWLSGQKLSVTVEAVPEGEVMFAHEPMLKVKGALWQCQLLEAALLNIMNYQTLMATMAARFVQVAGEDAAFAPAATVWEGGLRRAQDMTGTAASRAGIIGGFAGTSNVAMLNLYAIPEMIRGTFAHCFVMVAESELAAFASAAKAGMRAFLVDTYGTLSGVRNVIKTCQKLGIEPASVRLDSGDFTRLSPQVRTLLDAAGFPQCQIMVSNNIRVRDIQAHRAAGLPIDAYLVGTNAVTCPEQPALGGVYKLCARQDEGVMKFSDDPLKVSIPAAVDVVRFFKQHKADADVLVPEGFSRTQPFNAISWCGTQERVFHPDETQATLLVPVVKDGQIIAPDESLQTLRARAKTAQMQLPAHVLKPEDPAPYPLFVEEGLYRLRQRLMAENAKKVRP